jgi:hypothetical protein
MKAHDVLKELEEIAEKKSIKVSYETLAAELGTGGLCKVKGQHRIIVDRRATDGDKVNVVAQALARFPLDDVFMSEYTRQVIARLEKRLQQHAANKVAADVSGTTDVAAAPAAEAAKTESPVAADLPPDAPQALESN